MTWWMILLAGFALGVIVLVIAAMALRRKVPELRMALTALDERKKAAERLQGRLERMQSDVDALQTKLPQR
ncbi:MAG: hypothetical protein ACRDXX_11870 [Stackebrandtia sp.]